MPGTLPLVTALAGWRVRRARTGGLEGCSLVVPTFERPMETAALLETLAALPDPPAETVIVDGTQGDAVEAAVRRWSEGRALPFDLVYARAPRGLTRQRNAGIDISTGRYVFFLDDDAVPHPGYFSAVARVFERDAAAGGVGGAIVNQMDRPLNRRWRIRLALKLAPRAEPDTWHASGTSTPRALLKPFSGTRRVDLLPGCALAFRREVLESFRFSEFFDGYAQGEDLEMSLRVGRKWKLLSCGEARVEHRTAPGGRPGSFAKGRMEARNRYFIWKRHAAGAGALDRARFWGDLLFLIAMDAGWFCLRPWRGGALAHGLGVAWGAAGCLLAPPRYEEPPAGRRYRIAERHA